ncbi:hypothetical protein JCM5296_001878 [Sporobolomyces johnsonii]
MSSEDSQSAVVLQTASFDARFPNTNQSKHCFQSYVDYYRCINAKGEDFPACKTFWRTFHSLCPNEWIAKWDEQREENRFPAKLEV